MQSAHLLMMPFPLPVMSAEVQVVHHRSHGSDGPQYHSAQFQT
jgi:hypothetical protein